MESNIEEESLNIMEQFPADEIFSPNLPSPQAETNNTSSSFFETLPQSQLHQLPEEIQHFISHLQDHVQRHVEGSSNEMNSERTEPSEQDVSSSPMEEVPLQNEPVGSRQSSEIPTSQNSANSPTSSSRPTRSLLRFVILFSSIPPSTTSPPGPTMEEELQPTPMDETSEITSNTSELSPDTLETPLNTSSGITFPNTPSGTTPNTSPSPSSPNPRSRQIILNLVLSYGGSSLDNFDDIMNSFFLMHQPRGPPPTSKRALEKLHKVEVTDTMETTCSVCFEEFLIGSNVMGLPCQHIFHDPCLTKWLEERNTCPICRYELPVDDEDYETERIKRMALRKVDEASYFKNDEEANH